MDAIQALKAGEKREKNHPAIRDWEIRVVQIVPTIENFQATFTLRDRRVAPSLTGYLSYVFVGLRLRIGDGDALKHRIVDWR